MIPASSNSLGDQLASFEFQRRPPYVSHKSKIRKQVKQTCYDVTTRSLADSDSLAGSAMRRAGDVAAVAAAATVSHQWSGAPPAVRHLRFKDTRRVTSGGLALARACSQLQPARWVASRPTTTTRRRHR